MFCGHKELVVHKMASHESFYTSPNPTSSPPPPPPKPSSHDPSRAGTPSIPPMAPHPNQVSSQVTDQSSPAPPPLPQSPFDPSYQQQRQQQPPQQAHAQQTGLVHGVSQPSTQPTNPTVQLPALDSGWLPQGLDEYSTADLQPLLNNAELLDAFARQHPSYNASLEPLQAAISTNMALAQHVAQLEAQVKQLRDQTGQLLINHTSLQTQWRRKQSEMDDALSSWGPRAMYSRLVSSTNEQEAILRAVHDSFVEGGGAGHEYGSADGKATEKEVTEWVKRVREGTTVLEKRREMRQRWDEGRVGGWR